MGVNVYYPLFADLHGRRCVVVGGGLIAQRKVASLLKFGATVQVISPTVTDRLARYATRGTVRWTRRRFQARDARGAWLIIAATDERSVNERVFRAAERARIFVNVVDQKSLCSFIAPSVLKQGELIVAISTGGASPTVAKWLRRDLASHVGIEYARLLRLLKSLRGVAKQRLPRYRDRRRYFDQLMTGRVASLVRTGQMAAARREALASIRRIERQQC